MSDYELKKILEGSFNVYKDAILDVAVRSIKEHEYKTSEQDKVYEHDKDHIWYKGCQYISLRRFSEVKKESTDILDKIRAEIEHLTITEGGEDYTRKMAELYSLKFKVLQIIDKYRQEG